MNLLLLPSTAASLSAIEPAITDGVYYFSCPTEASLPEGASEEHEQEQDDWFIGAIDFVAASVHGFAGAA